MNEAEWLACDDPEAMLKKLADGESNRRWRLFALVCLEQLTAHLHDERLKVALGAVARDAEGDGHADDLPEAHALAVAAHQDLLEDASEQRWYYVHEAVAHAVVRATHNDSFEMIPFVATCCAEALDLATDASPQAIAHRHVAVIRDIFGNPFRPVTLDPLWLTFDVLTLARGIYESRDFSAMPILADALQDAGCDNTEVLNHCRDTKQVHVRGCWVLDLLLGKG